ncbi:DUF402 domain-containing protein [Arsenicicoccus dermatophilus]|uniref:DUF402 domain-containing protein n=1 Tax=Arsenicicoccus dermatophilus TaxID=1076331 RepID=UPI001F4D2671|nr:DUF402 domain-containing protein [Arsenicicoccus dermatophilus]MCH8611508.1 DUF402 domain-containing protein [Arsenicicoccus dermatophilus]
MQRTVGERVDIRFTKWDGGRHWEYAARYAGHDAHGRWLWMPAGTPLARPGRSEVAEHDAVMCVPRESGHVLTTHAAPHGVRHYVDITTPPLWSRIGGILTVSMVDLDLDVVERRDGSSYLDDEDEFADHQLEMAYPPELVVHAEAEAQRLMAAVVAQEEPFAADAESWLARGRELPGV